MCRRVEHFGFGQGQSLNLKIWYSKDYSEIQGNLSRKE